MTFTYKHFTTLAICMGALMFGTDLQASDLPALEAEVGKVKTFFTGTLFKSGMAMGTVFGILKAIYQGNIGLGMVTAGIGIGGFSLLSWINT